MGAPRAEGLRPVVASLEETRGKDRPLSPESIATLLEEVARRRADEIALTWAGASLTWRELDRRAAGVTRSLAAEGIGPGDRVAIALEAGWAFAAALLGVFKQGATAVPIDPRLSADEQRAIEVDVGARHIIRHVAGHEADRAAGPAGRTALILYTTGSTGEPKGALLSHEALAFALWSWAGPVMALTPDDVVLAALPPSHSFGLCGALLAPLLAGARVALLERFTPEGALHAIARDRVTVLPGVATMFRRILDAPALATADLSSLRLAVSGAAPCPWDLAEEWRTRAGARILRGYGMTELFRPVSYLAEDPIDRPDAIGRPVPGVEVRAVTERGTDCVPGEPGELLIRSPAVMDGYLNAPAETRAVMTDGWFRTGDLARLTPDGYVSIVGRRRERILRGGYSVMPAEVEAALLGHPAVAEAAVIGVPDAELGEDVLAFVTPRAGVSVSADDLIAHCRARLAAYKYPRRVTIVPELPKSPSGKILKARLPRDA
jgi:long-chain acyl-CoA synthetase